MDQKQYEELRKKMIIPEMKMSRGVIKEMVIGEDGKRYEIERVIELPYFEEEKK